MSRHHFALVSATLLAVSIALGDALTGAAQTAAARGLGDGRLRVEITHARDPDLILSLDIPGDRGIPGRITILVPRGFDIYPNRQAGSAVGDVSLLAQDLSYGTNTESNLRGKIVAVLPVTPSTCTTSVPTGLWQLQLSLLGQPLDVPLYLSPAGADDPPGTGTKIEFCAPLLPQTTAAAPLSLPITSLELDLGGLGPPSAHGSYLWRALVTPLATDRRTLRPEATYELRALTPVPNRLTLAGRYQSHTRTVQLTGRLTVNGTPRSHTTVEITALIRKVTSGGVFFDDQFAGVAKTNSDGRYSLRIRIRKTTGFVANADPAVRRCTGLPAAPAGCLNTTLPSAQSDPITISLPGP